MGVRAGSHPSSSFQASGLGAGALKQGWGPPLSYLTTLCRIFRSSWSRHTAKGQLLEPMICTLSTLTCDVVIWKERPGHLEPCLPLPSSGAASPQQPLPLEPSTWVQGVGAHRGWSHSLHQALTPSQPLPFPESRRSIVLGGKPHCLRHESLGSLTQSPL